MSFLLVPLVEEDADMAIVSIDHIQCVMPRTEGGSVIFLREPVYMDGSIGTLRILSTWSPREVYAALKAT